MSCSFFKFILAVKVGGGGGVKLLKIFFFVRVLLAIILLNVTSQNVLSLHYSIYLAFIFEEGWGEEGVRSFYLIKNQQLIVS